ncbi:MAG: MBL fold metallo-hydrolase [Nitrospinota bacterium]
MARAPKALPGPAKTQGFQEVADGIHVFIGGEGRTNFGFVLTKEGAIVIDNDIRARKPFVEGMRRITRAKVRLVLNTHHNFDHTSDNEFYAAQGAAVIGAEPIAQEMERERPFWFQQMAGRGPSVKQYIGKRDIYPPQVCFRGSLTMRLGGRTVELTHMGHGHTKGDSIVYFPQQKVLFTGDLVFGRTHPVARLANTESWLKLLGQLLRVEARYAVPGHGPVGRGKVQIEEMLQYWRTLRARVGALVRQGLPEGEIQKRVRMEEYRRWYRTQLVPETVGRVAREMRRRR